MPIFISATTLKDYVSCSEIIKFKLSGEKQLNISEESIIGTIVHDTISEKNEADRQVSTKSILESKGVFSDKNMLFVENCKENFTKHFRPHLSERDLVEHSFKIKYYTDVFLVGRIDRISNGLIFDWKTDRTPATKVENNIQLLFYELAYEKLFGEKPFGSYLGFLVNGSLVRHKKSSDADDILKLLMEEVLHTIKSNTFYKKGILTKSCYRCPFNIQCLGDK